jgi:outer membrane protein assembly factor BamD (BamD/ComL family)
LARPAGLRPAHEVTIIAPPDAASLFDRANRARRSGDRTRASDLYTELIDRFPTSPEGHESEAVLGHLLLHGGDARAALAHLDAYLRMGGPLTEDVTLDRALVLGRLGRASDEADAWRGLLRDYPSSVHAERAKKRLQELGTP